MKALNYNHMTREEWRDARTAYIAHQEGKCYHCCAPLALPPPDNIVSKSSRWELFPGGEDFLRYQVHLHHDHITGMTIGAVHAYCNVVLGQYHKE